MATCCTHLTLCRQCAAELNHWHESVEAQSPAQPARDWRTDRALRRLEAMLIVMDRRSTFLLSGTGDLIEPDDGIIGIGSGGAFAQAAAKALVRHSSLSAREVAEQSMKIASEICVYTNGNLTIEEL